MRELAVISGKGGTGKTSIVACFAALAGGRAVIADCDVDAANLGLIMSPSTRETHEFSGSKEPRVDASTCTSCGQCRDACRFGAMGDGATVDPLLCEGCGVCSWVCPEGAITMHDALSGHWYVSDTRYGTLVHARLLPGAGNSGKLVTAVRTRAAEIGRDRGADLVLIDGSPGIGCPVIASLAGVSAALVVAEPSLSGLHDLGRILDVCKHFGVSAVVCVNRCDLHPEGAEAIVERCRVSGVDVAGMVPYDTAVTEAMVRGLPVVEHSDGEASKRIADLWTVLQKSQLAR